MGSSCSGLLEHSSPEEGDKAENGGTCLCNAPVPLEHQRVESTTSPGRNLDGKSSDSSPLRMESVLGPLPCGSCSGAAASRELSADPPAARWENSRPDAYEYPASKVIDDERSDVIIGVPGDPTQDTKGEQPASAGVVAPKVRIADDMDNTSSGVPRGPPDPVTASTASGASNRSWGRGRSTWRSGRSQSQKSVSAEDSGKKGSRMSRLMSGRWGKQEGKQEQLAEQQPKAKSSAVPRPRNYINGNMPQDYKWLESILESIALNRAGTLGCKDVSNGKGFVPVFFVLGACPNIFCGMQAVMYSVGSDGDVDFWWVKPGKSDSSSGHVGVEENTLSRHFKGPYKNDPGRSKPFYKPLADLFKQEQQVGDLRFGIEQGGSGSRSRAFLEQASGGQSTRQYMHLVWQEDWTSNPFSRSKYIKGKIVYQKDPEALTFYSREYVILNGAITVSAEEEPPFCSVLPGEDIKDLKAD